VLGKRVTWVALAIGVFQPVQRSAQDTAPVSLRFHHLHYRVADPGEALGQAAEQLKGTRVILKGLGVGVRVGREYVLLDRETNDDGPVAGSGRRGRTASQAYAEAAQWLTQRRLVIHPVALAQTGVAAARLSATLDHLAFAADDPKAAVSALREKPLSATEDAARFRLRSGLIVEIVRDTDRPDAYWCPMHPDVRLPGEGTCSRCGMALVPIRSPRIGEYRLDVTTSARPGGGVSGFRVVVRDPETGDPVSSFVEVHERPFHLFIVSRDLAQFAHLHPEHKDDGSFEVRHDLDPGEYVLFADFLPAGGTPQLVHRAIVTPGHSGPLFAQPTEIPPGALEQIVGGLRIRLETPSLVPRRETVVRFHISDATTGSPVRDLQPYVGATGHLLIVSNDLTAAVHAHPEGATTGGPVVTFGPVFPLPGRYKSWVQFQRNGDVVTAAFVIDVP